MFKFFKKSSKTVYEKDDLNKMGECFICKALKEQPRDEFGATIPTIIEKEPLFNLFGVEVCEGCYHDLINHMGYKNIDDLLDCDKKQLMMFLNELIKQKTQKYY